MTHILSADKYIYPLIEINNYGSVDIMDYKILKTKRCSISLKSPKSSGGRRTMKKKKTN